jgi:predicted nuclease with TOPRIM domain
MNTLWNFIASYLPSIRIYNDLEDNYPPDDDYLSDDAGSDGSSYELPTVTSYHTMTLPRQFGQRHDRSTSRATALEDQHATDTDRLRVKQLETFNSRLQEQVLTLQRQLEHLQADFSSTKMELEHQRSTNTLLVSQKGQLSVELAQACAARQAQANEVHKLRTSYAELANSVRTLESNDEELKTLKSFLTKTDDFSGQQIVQAVHDLNSEILQLAAAVSDEFPLTRRSPGLWNESHCEIVRQAIGDGMLALLRDGDHENDPTVVQLAIQAWEVWCCRQVLDSFCAGSPPEVDRFLNDIFREMQSSGKYSLVP